MATLAIGAPLLAGGPPGWVLYGLLAVGTGIAALAVYEASKDATTTFPDTPPSAVQPCPPDTSSGDKAQPRPIPVPLDQPLEKEKEKEEEERRTCATDHPDTILCSALPSFYIYGSVQAAFLFLRDQYSDTLRMEKTRPADRGPCPGAGTHTAVRSGGAYIASIVCCPCCTDTAEGPVLSTKCGIV
jgi:hypothetical protein